VTFWCDPVSGLFVVAFQILTHWVLLFVDNGLAKQDDCRRLVTNMASPPILGKYHPLGRLGAGAYGNPLFKFLHLVAV